MGDLIRSVWEWARESFRYVPGILFTILTMFFMAQFIPFGISKIDFDIIRDYPGILFLCMSLSVSFWVLQQEDWSYEGMYRIHFTVLFLSYLIGAWIFNVQYQIIGVFRGASNGVFFIAYYLLNFVVIDYWIIRGVQHLILKKKVSYEASTFNNQWKDIKNSWSERNMW
jgi:hypothetical protein